MGLQDMKTIADFLIADFEGEMRTTVNVLASVPTEHLDYRPDAKSKTALDSYATLRSRMSGC